MLCAPIWPSDFPVARRAVLVRGKDGGRGRKGRTPLLPRQAASAQDVTQWGVAGAAAWAVVDV